MNQILQEAGSGRTWRGGLGNPPCSVKVFLEGEGKGDPSQELGVGRVPGRFSFWVFLCLCSLLFFRFVCGVGLAGSKWEVYPVPSDLGLARMVEARRREPLTRPRLLSADAPRAAAGMALRPPGEAGSQDKVCYPPERLQSSPPRLAAYYTPYLPFGHYGNSLAAAEENFQPFRQLEAAVSASQAVPPFAFRPAPPLLSPGLALQREPLYDLPWYSKLPPWYPIPHLPREGPPFLNSSRECTGAAREGLGHLGGRSDSDQCCGPEILIPPPPVDASLFPERLKTSQLLSCSSTKRSEDGPKLLSQEKKSPRPYHFTQEDLYLVLYGVIPSLEPSARLHHAISGLLVPTDSSGKGSRHQPGDGLDGSRGGRGQE